VRSGVRASHDGAVITRELAQNLAAAGLAWEPSSGDRFLVPDRDLDDEVFELPTGPEMKFNGTVEWALDSIGKHDVIWLPREDQLREALAHRFAGLERLDGATGGYAVVLTDGGRYVDIDAERAYARALLAVLST